MANNTAVVRHRTKQNNESVTSMREARSSKVGFFLLFFTNNSDDIINVQLTNIIHGIRFVLKFIGIPRIAAVVPYLHHIGHALFQCSI